MNLPLRPTRRRPARTWALGLAVLISILAACSAGGSPGTSPGPSGGPGPSVLPGPSGGPFNAGELRLLLIDQLGPRWYCDPDEYPIAHGTEQERAIERFAEMQAEGQLFTAVAERLGIDPTGPFDDAKKLAVYHLWKVALSIPLDPIGNGRYRFDYLSQPIGGASEGLRTAGIIDETGAITVEQRAAAGEPVCPICLARGTLIDTPDGPVAVEELRLGDPIWTMDGRGRRVAGTVIALGSTPAPAGHEVIRLELADARVVTASPGHPLADGRQLATVRVGDLVDGSAVIASTRIPYAGDATFDLVASGPTGTYFAGGIPLGTTLRPSAPVSIGD
jgi:hypothetical protein